MAPARRRRSAAAGPGLAAARRGAPRRGAQVTLFEMAPAAGGRARDRRRRQRRRPRQRPAHPDRRLQRDAAPDGARSAWPSASAFAALPLRLVDARRPRPAPAAGSRRAGLRRGPCSAARGWSLARPHRPAARRRRLGAARLRLRPGAHRRRAGGAACREAVRRELIEPLCVAALNTPAEAASGSVFLRVLHDALVRRPGRVRPAAAAPRAERAAAATGARPARGARAPASGSRIGSSGSSATWRADLGWQVDGEPSTRSCSPPARSRRRAWWRRTTRPGRHAPRRCATSRSSRSTRSSDGTRLPEPMLALPADDSAPGAVRLRPRPARRARRPARLRHQRRRRLGGARPRPRPRRRRWRQAREELAAHLAGPLEALRTIVEKRATFRCTPGLDRPPAVGRARAWRRPATTSTVPTPPRSKARCAAAPRRHASLLSRRGS